MKRRKEPTEFKLGTIVVPYIEMFDEAVAIRTEGVQLIIDTYFNDLSIDDIPQQYVFTWDWLGKGYKFTVINHLYKSSKAKTKQVFKKLLAEALPLLIDPKNGLIKKPELSPADLGGFNSILKQALVLDRNDRRYYICFRENKVDTLFFIVLNNTFRSHPMILSIKA